MQKNHPKTVTQFKESQRMAEVSGNFLKKKEFVDDLRFVGKALYSEKDSGE
jgi:hypothetical protein